MRCRKKIFMIVFSVVIITVSTTFNGCLKQSQRGETITPADSVQLPERGFFMGTLPTPGKGQSFEEAYQKVSRYSDFTPVWGKPTPFYELAEELEGDWGDLFVDHYIRDNGMFPLIHLSFIGHNLTLVAPSDLGGSFLSDYEWRASYKEAVLDVVRASRPLYLSIGNEVNRWYEEYGYTGPNGFQHYVSLYEEIYDDVKELSPETKVFCTFAREIVSKNRGADLEVLEMFDPDKLDLLILTSYPHSVQGINRPSEIPEDYYSKISDLMPDTTFGFSELAWPSMDAFGGEDAQAEFLTMVSSSLTIEKGIDLRFLGWAWLHDLSENDHTGLIKKGGDEKSAYDVWKDLSSNI